MIAMRYGQLMLRVGASILAGCIVIRPSSAQSIDYGAFEELFGEPITTSANGSPQRPSDVPANIEIVSAETIRR